MGLDAVELVMAVEETFEIAIEDSEAAKMVTPRHLIDHVMSKVGQPGQVPCLKQRAFHHIRASFMRRLGMQRNQIKPEAPMAALFPRSTRKKQLGEVLDDLGINKSIELMRPAWLSNTVVAGVLAGSLAVAIFEWRLVSIPDAAARFVLPLVSGGFCLAFFGWLGVVLTRGQRYEFQPSIATVGDFSRWVVAHSANLVETPPGRWNREQVAEKVRVIVIENLGLKKEQYREDANFVKDFGID